MKYYKKIEDISNLGKQKRFSKKVELEQEDYENLTEYAKKGIVADKEIYELNNRIDNLRSAVDKWKSKYDEIVEQTKDFFHAIKLAPQKVTNFFKGLFDKEKQELTFQRSNGKYLKILTRLLLMKKLGIQLKDLEVINKDLLRREKQVYFLDIYFVKIVNLNFIIVLLIISHQLKTFIDVLIIRITLHILVLAII